VLWKPGQSPGDADCVPSWLPIFPFPLWDSPNRTQRAHLPKPIKTQKTSFKTNEFTFQLKDRRRGSTVSLHVANLTNDTKSNFVQIFSFYLFAHGQVEINFELMAVSLKPRTLHDKKASNNSWSR
jgi:hypothetical protein